MLERIFQNKRDFLKIEVLSSRVTIGFLIGLIVWQQIVMLNRIESKTVVFTPPAVMSQEFWVSGNKVSKSYLEGMAQFIMFNAFNVTPTNASQNSKNILAIVLPEFYSEVEAQVDKQILYLVDNQISRVFYFSETNPHQPGIIKVNGVLKESIGNQIAGTYNIDVEINYSIVQGRFWLTGIKVVNKK